MLLSSYYQTSVRFSPCVELANASTRAMFGAVGAKCIAAVPRMPWWLPHLAMPHRVLKQHVNQCLTQVRCVTLIVVSFASAAGLMLQRPEILKHAQADNHRSHRASQVSVMAG